MSKTGFVLMLLCFATTGMAQPRLTLEQSKAMALEHNVSVKNSKLELNMAQETKEEANTLFFPKISATAMGVQAINPILEMKMQGGNLPVYDGNPAHLAGATEFAYMPDVNMGLFNQFGLGYVNAAQPVYAGGKIKTGNQLADLNIEVKQKMQKLSADEVLLKTEQQYRQVIVIQEQQKTLADYIRFLDTLYTQVDNAYQNGLVIKNDLLRVTIKQSELKVSQMQLENGKKLSLMQLCQTIGMEYNPEMELEEDLDELPLPQVYYISNDDALPQRTEFQLLEKAVTASKLETRLKKGDYQPTVGVGVAGYYLDQFQSHQKGAFNGLVYASVSVPISDWWGGKHKLREMRYKEEIARNNLNDNKRLLNLQMEKAWTDLQEAYRKIQLTEETLEQTTENLKVNQDSYNNGLIQLSDLLEARALKAETENKLIIAKSEYKTAITEYLKVTGRMENGLR